MSFPFKPRLLSFDEFNDYTTSWEQLIDSGSSQDLQACFTSSTGAFINYAYLTSAELEPLLQDAQPTDLIKTKFLLMPGEVPAFSLALLHTNADGKPLSDYYLAGVAALPADLDPDILSQATPRVAEPAAPDGKVPIETARIWIRNWHNMTAADLNATLFNSPQEGQHLRGYTFMVTDFTTPWTPSAEAALWLNFDLKPQTADDPDSPLVFSTIIEINTIPVAGHPGKISLQSTASFYDVSRPSPPFS